jgi:hypothetical protein
MAGTDSELIKGMYDLGNVQDRLRIYAQNQQYFQFWALRQVNTITILKLISEKFGSVPTGQITDWEFRYPEFDEIQYQFYLTDDTADTNKTELLVTNDIGSSLTTSHRLHVNGIWTKKTVTDMATDVSATFTISTGIVIPEELRIVSVGAEDSGGVGKRKITVRRAHPADAPNNLGSTPAITTTMQLTVMNLVTRANDYPQPPITKNSKYLDNYVQITRMSYGLGEHMVQGGGIETYLAKGVEYLNIQYQLAETYMMKAMERAIIGARKSKKDINGNLEYETGGLLEFIENDTDHILDFGAKVPTVQRINNLVRRMADTSGVKELWLFTGTQLSEQIANAYENKSIYYTQAELSVRYMMKVKVLESVGRDLTVYHVTAPIMNEMGMANEGLVLNLTEYNYNQKNPFGCFQIAHKVPFNDQPDDNSSYKSNEGFKGKWRELYGAWGLVRRLPETHFRWVNAAAPDN